MYFSLNNDILQLIVPILYGIYTPVRIVFIQNIRDSTGVAFAHVFNYSRVWLNRYTGYPFGTPLASLVHYLSLKYSTIFYWPIGYPHDTIMSSICHSAILMTLYYLLQAHRLSYDTLPTGFPCDTLLCSTVPQAIPMVFYYFLLAHWRPLWYTTIFFWPTGYPYGILLYSTIPQAIPMILFYLLLSHRLSQWYSTVFYWHTSYPYGTPLSSSGSLDIPMVLFYFLLVYRLSLWYSTIFY